MAMEDGPSLAKDARVRDAWTSYACSQTEQLLPSAGDTTAEILETKRSGFADHLNAIRVAESLIRQRLNTLASIYRLADETLAHILSLVCAGRCPNPSFPVDLMLVSTRWCSVVRTYPGIWSHPPLPINERGVGALLDRAKAAPLHLDWQLGGMYIPHNQRNLDLAPWMLKCRTLAVHATATRARTALSSLGEKSNAPLLESMSVTVDRSNRYHRNDPEMIASFWPSELFSNSTPRLRKLRLIELGYFRWTHTLLCTTLSYLEITFSDKSYVFPQGRPTDDDTRTGGCSYDDLLDTLERLVNLRTLVLTRCASTSLLFGNASPGRQVRLDNLYRLHVWDNPQACTILCQTLVWPRSASVMLRFPWSEQREDMTESVGEFMRSIRIEESHNTELDITVAHQDSSRVPHRSVSFCFHRGKAWGRVRLEAVVYRPRKYGTLAKYTVPLWYREQLVAMASSLRLQEILALRVRIDPGAAAPSKTMWLDAFPHTFWVTELLVDNAQVPALASALGKQDLYERDAVTRLFPRLAHIVLSKAKTRDIDLLQRAMQRRAPRSRMILGRFIIDAEVVKRKPSQPRIVFIKPDGSRVPVRTVPMRHDLWGTSREWFDVRKALQAQRERRRARGKDKDTHISPGEHLFELRQYTCFRHKHALRSAPTGNSDAQPVAK